MNTLLNVISIAKTITNEIERKNNERRKQEQKKELTNKVFKILEEMKTEAKTCAKILTSGKRKGNLCGREIKDDNDFCNLHLALGSAEELLENESKEQIENKLCNKILTTGKRKGEPCNRDVKDLNNTVCNSHLSSEDKPIKKTVKKTKKDKSEEHEEVTTTITKVVKKVKKVKPKKIKEEIEDEKEEEKSEPKKKAKRPNIPKYVKTECWQTHIGKKIGSLLCPYCTTNELTQLNFECGHVLAYAEGGTLEISNLRPLCKTCNSSLGKKLVDILKWDKGLQESMKRMHQ